MPISQLNQRKIIKPVTATIIAGTSEMCALLASHANRRAGIIAILPKKSPVTIKQGNEIKTVASTFCANNLLRSNKSIGMKIIQVRAVKPKYAIIPRNIKKVGGII